MKNLILPLLLIACLSVQAQITPNGGFETWIDSTSYENPDGWESNNSTLVSLLGSPTVVKDTDAYSGSYAAKIQTQMVGVTQIDTFAGILTNGSIDSLSYSGDTISYQPQKLTGYYKFDGTSGDSAFAIVYLNKYSSIVGHDEVKASGNAKLPPAASWTYFEIDIYDAEINPPTPESFVIVLSSTKDIANPKVGTLWVDELNFSGVASIEPLTKVGNMEVYPNPATDLVTVDWQTNGIQQLQLFDVNSRLIKTIDVSGTNHTQLDVSTLEAGKYFVVLADKLKMRTAATIMVTR